MNALITALIVLALVLGIPLLAALVLIAYAEYAARTPARRDGDSPRPTELPAPRAARAQVIWDALARMKRKD